MIKTLRDLRWLVVFLITWADTAAQPPTSVSGRVPGYVSHRIGDYDGIRLRTVSGELQLHFPPHTAAKIRRLAAVGQLIQTEVPLVKTLRSETGQLVALLTDKYLIELKPHQGE